MLMIRVQLCVYVVTLLNFFHCMFEIFLDKMLGRLWNYHFWESKTLDKPLVLKDNGKESWDARQSLDDWACSHLPAAFTGMEVLVRSPFLQFQNT